MMIKIPITIISLCCALILSACDSESFRQADNKVLCEAITNQAFLVREGTGVNSYVEKAPFLQKMCGDLRPVTQAEVTIGATK